MEKLQFGFCAALAAMGTLAFADVAMEDLEVAPLAETRGGAVEEAPVLEEETPEGAGAALAEVFAAEEEPAGEDFGEATGEEVDEEGIPVDGVPEAAPPAAETAGEAPKGDGSLAGVVDEIDLEEYDDAADAAKAASVKAVAQDGPFDASDRGALVDIMCDDATLSEIVRQFRRTTRANIICAESSNLTQRVSVTMTGVPWLDSLQSILNARGFRLEPRGGIYFVSEDKDENPIFTRPFQLNHADAAEMAGLFNESFGKKDGAGKVTHRIAAPFPGANVVVVTADEKVLSDCAAIVKAVDQAVSQIYIEARFIELSSDAMHKLGLKWDSLEDWGASLNNLAGGREVNRGRLATYKYRNDESTLSRETSDFRANVVGTGTKDGTADVTSYRKSGVDSVVSDLSKERIQTWTPSADLSAAPGAGRAAESMAWRRASGYSGQLSMDGFRLAMSAFESVGEAKVFSNPKIIVSNGKEAKVDMTTKVPCVTEKSNWVDTGNGKQQEITYELSTIPGHDKQMFAGEAFFSYGITLSVTPRISPDGMIAVDIVPAISERVANADVGPFPTIKVNRLVTNFTMKDGATAVIGGLSRTQEADIDSGIPLLRKIPWIGPRLFGWKSRQKTQNEIIVFVTIGIAHPDDLPADVGLPKNAVLGREYAQGSRLEPGDREDGPASLVDIDVRPLERQRAEERKAAADRRRAGGE